MEDDDILYDDYWRILNNYPISDDTDSIIINPVKKTMIQSTGRSLRHSGNSPFVAPIVTTTQNEPDNITFDGDTPLLEIFKAASERWPDVPVRKLIIGAGIDSELMVYIDDE